MVSDMNPKQKTVILLILALTLFLVILDTAIVNVALPAIKEALNFDRASLQWVITSYVLTFGGFLMFGGRVADLYGRRKVLMAGVIGFTVCSLLIGLSQTSIMFIALRALQGLAGAFMIPAALSILLTSFKEGPERNKALSVWSAVGAGGAAVGVLLGGLITQYFGWQWNFFVNVPLGILAIIGIRRFIPADAIVSKATHLDVPGAVLVTGGLMALVYAITQAPEIGWTSMTTIGTFVLSIVLLAGFVFNETKSDHPLVPFSIFNIRNVVAGNLMMVPVMAGALGLFFFTSLYIQNILHYSPALTGISFLPVPIIIGIMSIKVAPRLIGKFGFKPLLITGTALLTIGTFLLGFLPADASYVLHLLPGFLLMGVGLGLAFISITIAATATVPAHETGLASGLINTSQQLGGALGIAMLSGIASAVTVGALAGGESPSQAILSGYQIAFFAASALMAVALLVSIFVIQAPKRELAAS